MKILKDKNELKNIVERHAKYQKVMLVFDDNVTSVEIFDIYNLVKGSCVFNKIHLSSDLNELNNGYKLLIFLCSAENYLKLKINLSDFVNVFMPTNENILPFYLKNFVVEDESKNYLLITHRGVDLSLFASVIFNQFFSYFCRVVGLEEKENFIISFNEINQNSQLEFLNQLRGEKFFDLQCICACGIDYCDLVLTDYLLVSAMSVFIKSVHENALLLTDIYKVVGEDYTMLDKYYSMATNDYLLEVTNLNFFNLNKFCEKAKNELLFFLKNHFDCDLKKINEIVKKLHVHLKNCNSFLGYLFLYDIIPTKI